MTFVKADNFTPVPVVPKGDTNGRFKLIVDFEKVNYLWTNTFETLEKAVAAKVWAYEQGARQAVIQERVVPS